MGDSRITGTYYVKKDGNNADSGATYALAKKDIQNAMQLASNGTVVVSSGVYSIANFNHYGTCTKLIADGNVVLDCTDGSGTLFNAASYIPNGIWNITFRNWNFTTNTQVDLVAFSAQNCMFINCGKAAWTAGVLIGSYVNISTSTSLPGIGNILIGGQSRPFQGLWNAIVINHNCLSTPNAGFIDEGIYSDFASSFGRVGSVLAIKNSCLQGKVIVSSGLAYAVPDITDRDGVIAGTTTWATRAGSYPSGITDFLHVGQGISATTCYVTNNIFNTDPQFNDVANLDFTVLPTSPLLMKSTKGNGNIGNVTIASNTRLLKNDTLSNATVTGDDVTITTGNSNTITSGVLTLNTTIAKAIYLNLTGSNWFNIDSAGGTSYVNENVPWIYQTTKNSSTYTNTSKRLSIKIRWSNKATTPSASTDSDWDNGNASTTPCNGLLAGEYSIVNPINNLVKIDSNGYGDGTLDFTPNLGFTPSAKYFMYIIEEHNNYA